MFMLLLVDDDVDADVDVDMFVYVVVYEVVYVLKKNVRSFQLKSYDISDTYMDQTFEINIDRSRLSEFMGRIQRIKGLKHASLLSHHGDIQEIS